MHDAQCLSAVHARRARLPELLLLSMSANAKSRGIEKTCQCTSSKQT